MERLPIQKAQIINYYLLIVVKVGRFYPCSINGSAKRFYSCTTIGRLCIGDKKLEDLILVFRAGRFHLRSSIDVLEGFIFTLLLEATDEKRKNNRV